MEYRIEKDSMGEIKVPIQKYYGSQTVRSLNNFKIGTEVFPMSFIYSYVLIKKSAAITNNKLGLLDEKKKNLIVTSCDEILEGKFDGEFPLRIWQTGSGTQTNMNINEVIAGRANELSGCDKGSKSPVHPNDHVNMCQSTNDTFPAAMHVSAVMEINNSLLPGINSLIDAFKKKSAELGQTIKIGRTHLMDATPVTLSQEWGAYISQLQSALKSINFLLPKLYSLPLGGTAVGTGINSHKNFGNEASKTLSALTGCPFLSAENKFEAISAHDVLLEVSGVLKTMAACLNKIGSDIRLLGSGPRAGIYEYILPANEPGSSIMPGKVNPTQSEALTMVSAQVFGNDVTINIAGSQGHFQLNAYKPVIIYNLLQSIMLLGNGALSFAKNCVEGLKINKDKIEENLNNSLMLVTSLSPHIGYDNASKVAKEAFQNNISIKDAVLKLKLIDEKEVGNLIDPKNMIKPVI